MVKIFLYAGYGRRRYKIGLALIDEIDFVAVSDCGYWNLGSNGYAWLRRKGQAIHLHHFIVQRMGLTWDTLTHEIDHKNRIKLDNQRENLRIATRSENISNQLISMGESGYRGVTRHHTDRWIARIRIGQTRPSLGIYDTPEDAARAYNQAALVHFGEFAILNIIEDSNE